MFSILQHRAQPAERLVSANTRPAIACVDDATPQVYQARRPEITVVYQLPKPLPNGQTQKHLKPEEFQDRLAMLLPKPREHRHSYHGVFAAHARLRKEVVARAGLPINEPPKVTRGVGDTQPQPSDEQGKAKDTDGQKGFGRFKGFVSGWAMLLARIYDVFPLVCPQCGGSMRVLSAVTEIQSVEKILTHINEPIEAPVMTPARWPPQAGFDFDQRVDDEGATDQTLILGSLLYWMLKLKVTLGTYWLMSFRCFFWH